MDVVESPQIQQPIQSVQQIPVEPKKKSNLPVIVILLIAILLVGVGGVYAGMQLSKKQTPVFLPPIPTPEVRPTEAAPTSISDETANWKTYIDQQEGFSFKYPSNWTFKEYPARNSDPKAISVESDIIGSGDIGPLGDKIPYYYSVSASKYKLPTGKSLEEYVKSLYGQQVYKEGMLNSYRILQNPEMPSMRGMYSTFFEGPNKDSFVEMSFSPYSSKEPYPRQSELFNIYTQILSTFKFTN